MVSAYNVANSWPDTNNAHGVLFVAQLWKEMLDPQTFESFRAYTLDTSERMSELQDLMADVARGRIPGAAGEPCVEELVWSIEKDPALAHYADEDVDVIKSTLKSKNIDQVGIEAINGILNGLLSDSYIEKLTDIICENIANPSKRIVVRKAAGFLLSHIINLGYKKSYIYKFLN